VNFLLNRALFALGLGATLRWPNQRSARRPSPEVRIPIQGGQVFRFDGGHRSNVIAATIPI
jgi:hypothetical protein